MAKVLRHIVCVAFLAVLLALGLGSVSTMHDNQVNFHDIHEASDLEDQLTDVLPARTALLMPFRVLNTILGRTYYQSNNIYIRDGVYLQGSSAQDVSTAAAGIEELASFCEGHGIGFLHVVLPGKPQYDEDVWERGIPCHRNETADRFEAEMERMGIPHLDLREAFRCDDYYARWFFATDHHWNPEAALYAAQLISSELNRGYGYHIDLARLSNERMLYVTSPFMWAGETGSKILGNYGGLEGFTAVLPAYEVNMRFVDEYRGIDQEGDFGVLFDMDTLDPDAPYPDHTLYYSYIGWASGIVEIYNLDVADGNVLLVHDSYSNAMAPMLALGVHHITLWDARYQNGSLYEYLEAHPEIDTVIVAYTISFVPTSYMNTF